MISIHKRIADELKVAVRQVEAAVTLLDGGATVPFISRYRKEVTGGLDDTQLRTLEERLTYLRELEDRRASILKIIEEQGKLTPELAREIAGADTKTRLEDLYLPYKKKRRTKGQIAIEAGIGPLADALHGDPTLAPEREARKFIHQDGELKEAFGDIKSVLDGAKFILMERFAENADLLGELRTLLGREGRLVSTVVEGKESEGAKFRDYFDNRDAVGSMPSHRALAMFRGRKEGMLQLRLEAPHEEGAPHPCESIIARKENIRNMNRPADKWLAEVVHWAWVVKLQMHMETELLSQLRGRAEDDAIVVFARNLKDLLLAAPAGQRAAIGLDPGLRTGVKIAVIDNTGQFVDSTAIFPHAPRKQWDASIAVLAKLAARYDVDLLAIGNGTASRETDKLCGDLMKRHPELKLQKVMVSEAGASVYSASETAAREFPDLDVTIRGAVSIGRRLQDPLAELVKIEPKSIGVGQYQHDVSQLQLARKLDAVVEDCVNGVGVDVNTASASLLNRVAGINQTVADNIVEYRNREGQYRNRKTLKAIPRLGNKAYEQAAGFLRIHNGDNPLDASAVHPESYTVVKKIIDHTKLDIRSLVGNSTVLKKLNPADYVDEKFGLPTVIDIISELEKPGRDPRPTFQTAAFREGVERLSDLENGMTLEGTVTNVTNFGAFVDIGVHQDGLVHISALANHFVKDPHDVVKAGDIVKVKVLEVDLDRKRIALSMRSDKENNTHAKPAPNDRGKQQTRKPDNARGEKRKQWEPKRVKPAGGTLADAFAKAKGQK